MSPAAVRAFRGLLVLLVVGVLGLVAWTFQKRPVRGPDATAVLPSDPPPADSTSLGKLVHEKFISAENGEQVRKFEIRAQSYEGSETSELRMKGVSMTFRYMARGTPGHSTISADECLYTPAVQKAVFRGNVKIATEEGFALQTGSLIYRGDKDIARTEDPVSFQRKDLSGTARGMTYQAAEGRLEMLADVVVRIEDPDNVPTDIKAGRATIERNEEGMMKFTDKVVLVQGNDRLQSERLLVNFDPVTQAVARAQAVDDVSLHTGSGTDMPGLTGATAGRGPRHLVARKLDMFFRPDRTLQEMTAGQDADLTMRPGPGEPQETRRLRSRFLVFVFDEQGRLQELRGQKDTIFDAKPLPGAKDAPLARTITCQTFQAVIDPGTGEPKVIEFSKDVEFTQGRRRATATKAYYDGPKATLFLGGDPLLLDAEQGTELRAEAIDIGTTTGDLAARTAVRHLLTRKSPKGGLLGAGDEPVLVTARSFSYTAKTKMAFYREDALLRSGKDEVRAAEIRLTEEVIGQRLLHALGSVVSRMQPTSRDKAQKKLAAVEGRAREMVYEEGLGRIVYTGDVTIRQGDILTRSPGATLSLTPDGGAIKTLQAGEPVEVEQGARRATGTRGTYSPTDETMLLVGEKVVLRDPKQQVEGKSLTFHVGDDRILVDGRQEVRTQMIIRQESRQHP